MSEVIPYFICGVVLIYMIFMLRFLFLSFKAHNDLVRFEYENIRDEWERDGEPQGMLFWRAPTRPKKFVNAIFWSNPGLTALSWIFKTPKWVKDFPQAQKHLRSMRLNTVWWNIGILFPMVLFLILGLLGVYD
jgi:hypothetical protein